MGKRAPQMPIHHISGNIQPGGDFVRGSMMEPVQDEHGAATGRQIADRLA